MKKILVLCMAFVALSFSASAQYEYKFTVVKQNPATPVKDQGSSSTCWCFGTTSMLESEVLRKGGPELDLSEMFIVRNNYIERTRDNYIRRGKGNVGPGSIPHIAINVYRKYGCMPEKLYPGMEYVSPNGRHYHKHLIEWMDELSKLAVAKEEGYPQAMFEATVDSYLGKVPATFKWEGKEYTPLTYFKSLGINLDDYVEITSFSHHPFYQMVPCEIPDNWDHALMYNLPLDEFIEVLDNAIMSGYTVAWDGDLTNNGYDFSKSIALYTDTDIKHSEKIMERVVEKVETQESRQRRFESFDLVDDHIEHITGIAKDQEGVKYYITKNSWGKRRNADGYHYMSLEYVKSNTICYLVHKDAIPAAIRKKMGL